MCHLHFKKEDPFWKFSTVLGYDCTHDTWQPKGVICHGHEPIPNDSRLLPKRIRQRFAECSSYDWIHDNWQPKGIICHGHKPKLSKTANRCQKAKKDSWNIAVLKGMVRSHDTWQPKGITCHELKPNVYCGLRTFCFQNMKQIKKNDDL
jgi:hypothetical protein